MLELVPGLSKLLDFFSENRRRRDDQIDHALITICAAATETKVYLEKLERTGRRDRKQEETLVRLWNNAAIPVRRYDRELANRCLAKSEYWISPERWTAQDVKAKRIDIDVISQRVTEMVATM